MSKHDVSSYESFDQITGRLDTIVDEVRDSGISLERSLDLFEEAIALGSHAVEMVDATALTDEEKARLEGQDVPDSDSSSETEPGSEDGSLEAVSEN